MTCDSSKNRYFRTCALVAVFAFFIGHIQAQEPRLFDRPVAIVHDRDPDRVLVANRDMAALIAIDFHTFETSRIEGKWPGIVDAVILPDSSFLIAITTAPPSLLQINTAQQAAEDTSLSIPLSDTPTKVAVSPDGLFACVSMTWSHSVDLVDLTNRNRKSIPLNFAPKELLAMPKGNFLVADAFGGQLAVIDAGANAVVATHELTGHHIGGMAHEEAGQQVLITHQRLSKVAESNRDDIHWGSLMQNGVACIPIADLYEDEKPIGRNLRFRQLDSTGHGTADPAGIVTWGTGDIAVAVSGTNQIAYWSSRAKAPIFVDVGLLPTRLVSLPSSRLLCLNTLDNTASLVDVSHGIRVIKVFGQPNTVLTVQQRGEAAFFSGKLSHDGWMSCSSCHVDGHSTGLLADTMGDGSFGTPKRIPSLLNTAVTGPWGWNGGKPSLEEQIQNTLVTTMHRNERSRINDQSDADVARDIAAYLKTFSVPTRPTNTTTGQGAQTFRERGCIKCHDPNQHYTSAETYDVGVHDERAQKQFNPPSLSGLRYRRSYFHDGRFRSLDELLQSHPPDLTALKPEALTDLKAFLMALPGPTNAE